MRIKLLCLICLSIVFNSDLFAQTEQSRSIKDTRLSTYRDKIRNEPRIVDYDFNDKRGTPGFIRFNENASFALQEADKLFSTYLPLRTNIDQLTKIKEDAAYKELAVQRFQQYFKGIKVEHGSYTVTAKNDKISFMSGEFYAIDAEQKTIPAITEEYALNKAMQSVNATAYIWQTADSVTHDGKKPQAELVFVDNIMYSKGQRLAYKFNIYAIKPLSRANIYVDAETGEIILSDAVIKHVTLGKAAKETTINNAGTEENNVQHTNSPLTNITASAVTRYTGTRNIITDQVAAGVYRLRETGRTTGVNNTGSYVETFNCKTSTAYAVAVDFTDADNNWTAAEYNNAAKDNAALDAHWGAEKVIDYWWNIHGRRSIDNKGFGIKNFIHYDVSYNNAYWNGTAMTYGDGSGVATGFDVLTALDVCGHEIGHGLCEFTAGLVYSNESGAMNEGFSDIWGACIENYTIGIGDVPGGDNKEPFKIGEEIVASAAQPLRSMSNPNSTTTYGQQPDTYLGNFWATGTADNGGVHTNSGVLNHWFYVLVQGESGTNDIGSVYSVTGIGWTKAEKIAYITELNLTANATYANCRTASINAAIALYGRCSAEVTAVTNAWYAVGVGAIAGACTTSSTVQFAINTDKAYEGAGKANCTYPSGAQQSHTINAVITLSNVSSATLATDATITLTGSSATLGRDYTISPSVVTWAPNTSGPKDITITIFDDNNSELNETIVLGYTLNNHGGTAVTGTVNQTETITITDDDTTASTYAYDAILGNFDAAATGSFEMFRGASLRRRIQYMYTANEMKIAGIKPGNISHLYLYIIGQSTTTTFTNLNIILGTTAATNLNTAFATLATSSTVYNGNYTTPTNENFFDFPLATPLYWDGTSNIIVQACYDNTSGTTNYPTAFTITGTTNYMTRYVASGTAGATLCGTTTVATASPYRPDIALAMYSPVQSVKNLSRTAYLGPNADVSFYSETDGKLMARIVNATTFDYGCTQVQVDRDGTGGTVFWKNGAANLLANKTFRVLPTTDNPSGAYTITLYYTQAEHDGWESASGKDWETLAKIVKVKGHDISEITPSATTLFTDVTINSSTARSAFTNDYQVSASFNTGFSGFGVGDPTLTPLPIKLTSFTGSKQNTTSILNWVTSNEFDNDRFEIESSTDGINFQRIGIITGKGDNVNGQHYAFVDQQPANGVNYYRLKQIDKSGAFTYSNIVAVEFALQQYIRINPNPAKDLLNITIGNPSAGIIFKIYAFDGRLIYTESKKSSMRTYQLGIANLPAGSYLLKATVNDQDLVQRFIKE